MDAILVMNEFPRHQGPNYDPRWLAPVVRVLFAVAAVLFFYAWHLHGKAIDVGQQRAKDVTLAKIDDPNLEKVAHQILDSVDLTYCWQRKRDDVARSASSIARLWVTEKDKKTIQKSAELGFNECYATRLLDMRTVNHDGVGDKLLDAMLPRSEKQLALSDAGGEKHE